MIVLKKTQHKSIAFTFRSDLKVCKCDKDIADAYNIYCYSVYYSLSNHINVLKANTPVCSIKLFKVKFYL